MKLVVKIAAGIAVALTSAVLVPVATASPSDHPPLDKTIWHMPNLDPIVSEIAGVPLHVDYSDNQAEWNYIADGEGVLGFTCITCSPYSTQYNPFDGYEYNILPHRLVCARDWRHPQQSEFTLVLRTRHDVPHD